jgi:hypothetical protein
LSDTSDAATDPFLDEEWLASKNPRSRWRVALLTALAVSVVFLAGAQAQKHFGPSSSTAASGAPGFPGGQGIPAGFPQLGGPGTTQPSSGASDAGEQTSSLIGTVTSVKGNTLQVKDFGGTTHTVTIGAHTSITRLATLRASDIKPGSTLVIKQPADASKHHPATAITVR